MPSTIRGYKVPLGLNSLSYALQLPPSLDQVSITTIADKHTFNLFPQSKPISTMKNSYIATIFVALVGITSASKNGEKCVHQESCSVMLDFPRGQMSSEYGMCFEDCMRGFTKCCHSPCGGLEQPCRVTFSNCHHNCGSHEMPAHFQCFDSCMGVWDNCMAEAVTADQADEHSDHCNNDFVACRKRCH